MDILIKENGIKVKDLIEFLSSLDGDMHIKSQEKIGDKYIASNFTEIIEICDINGCNLYFMSEAMRDVTDNE